MIHVVAESIVNCKFDYASFGITRLSDVTALDIINIPVWCATRPNSRNLSQSQGKGLTPDQAMISAIMESVEGAVAEQTRRLIAKFGSLNFLQNNGDNVIGLRGIDRCKYSAFDPNKERAWVRGVSVSSGDPFFSPYELIGLDMRANFPWDHRTFKMGSGGLAAGLSFEFAALRAILELIERDAIVLVQALGLQRMFARPVAWHPGIHSGLDDAVGKVRAAGLEPRFFEVPSRFGLPVVAAAITRPVLHADGAGYRLSGGYGCRFSAGEAALAALLEAVQSRLTNITGSRDDMSEAEYELASHHLPPLSAATMSLQRVGASCEPIMGKTDDETLRSLARRLISGGCDDVYLFDLPGPVDGVHVVRALVPGLRAYFEGEPTHVGVADALGLPE
ncbi:YcaO-like family protein [Labrys neptuniae]